MSCILCILTQTLKHLIGVTSKQDLAFTIKCNTVLLFFCVLVYIDATTPLLLAKILLWVIASHYNNHILH